MNEIIVSVILLVYNHEKYLKQAIDSILMQEVDFNYEIIIAEDKSTDSSRGIIDEYVNKYPDLFVVLYRNENIGATKNSYEACLLARGKYIANLEGDDYWTDKKKLKKMVEFLEKDTSYIGVSHIIEGRDLENRVLFKSPILVNTNGEDIKIENFLKGKRFSAVATVFKNIFKDETNDYSIIHKANRNVGDYTLAALLLDKGNIRILNETMSVYRSRSIKGESNYNSINNSMQKAKSHISLIKNVDKYFNGKYDFTGEYLKPITTAFYSFLKNNQLSDFYTSIYKILPMKVKLLFFAYMPYGVSKMIISKAKKC